MTGAFAVTEAVIGPQSARLIDRYGQTRVVPLLVTVHALAIAGLLAGGPMVPLAVLAGATIPQVGALVAARWSHALAGSELLTTAFALESMASSVAFLAGPALVGTVATLADPRAGRRRWPAALVVTGRPLALSAQRATGSRRRPSAGPTRGRAARARVARLRRGRRRQRRARDGLRGAAGLGRPRSRPLTAPRGSPGRSTASMNLACLGSAAFYGRAAARRCRLSHARWRCLALREPRRCCS